MSPLNLKTFRLACFVLQNYFLSKKVDLTFEKVTHQHIKKKKFVPTKFENVRQACRLALSMGTTQEAAEISSSKYIPAKIIGMSRRSYRTVGRYFWLKGPSFQLISCLPRPSVSFSPETNTELLWSTFSIRIQCSDSDQIWY